MRRENKGCGTFVSFTFLDVNNTSFPPKCFFQKNNEICKTVSDGLFSLARLFLKASIQQLAIEKRSIILRSDATLWRVNV